MPRSEKDRCSGRIQVQKVPGDPDGLSCLQFENMIGLAGVRQAVFTRKGGCSSKPFDRLNVAHGVGDRPENVSENRNRIARHLSADRLIFLKQVHGDKILIFNRKDKDVGAEKQFDNRVGDAMITDRSGILLVIQVADCQAVVLVDPVKRVVANIHAGWRGSVGDIIGKTVASMQENFACDPSHVLAGVGPSLGPCCAEFVNYRAEIPRQYWKYKDSNDHFDFWGMSCDQLCRAGVPGGNICLAGCCTRCHTDLFFSYRAEKVTGRFAVAVGLT